MAVCSDVLVQAARPRRTTAAKLMRKEGDNSVPVASRPDSSRRNAPRRSRAKADANARVGALLRDLAAVQTSPQSRWGYKRAASAILTLEEPLEDLLQPDG